MAAPAAELLEKLNGYGEAVTFLGDGVPVFRNIIEETLTVPFSFAPAHVNKQRAGAGGGPRGCVLCRGQSSDRGRGMFRIICAYPRRNGNGQKRERAKREQGGNPVQDTAGENK